jgi:8-oxo-dGTP diphosphatase
VVVVEKDGRVWLAIPRGAFGGILYTFPKGRVEKGESAQKAGVRETFEETGLLARVDRYLGDWEGARYYVGHRVGGSPAGYGPETEKVSLVYVLSDKLDSMLRDVGGSETADHEVLEGLRRNLSR